MQAVWSITLLGGLRARGRGLPELQFRTRKCAGLLALLALTPGRPRSREELIEKLWAEADVQDPRHSLSVELSALRLGLEPAGVPGGSVLHADRHSVRLNAAAVETDLAQFELLLGRAEELRGSDPQQEIACLDAAIRLYRGRLLCDLFEEWVLERQRWEEQRFLTAGTRLVVLLAPRAPEAAIARAVAVLQHDPYHEPLVRELMRLHHQLGHLDAAAACYADFHRRLRTQLARAPAPETAQLAAELGLCSPAVPPAPAAPAVVPSGAAAILAEPVGGAVPLNSSSYIGREADRDFAAALEEGTAIVLLQGPREVGKTSLLARGLQRARAGGARTACVDLQPYEERDFASTETLLRAISRDLLIALGEPRPLSELWDPEEGPVMNFRALVRGLLTIQGSPRLVLAVDEADRVFPYPFCTDVFAPFRAWYNERATHPDGPLSRLTVVLVFAAEPRLAIRDLNMSPFNVGTTIPLKDFTREELAELNRRHGAPLRTAAELTRLRELVGGHPVLARLVLRELARGRATLAGMERHGTAAESPVLDHLRRLGTRVARSPVLEAELRQLLRNQPPADPAAADQLRGLGVVHREGGKVLRFRCGLYERYFRERLAR